MKWLLAVIGAASGGTLVRVLGQLSTSDDFFQATPVLWAALAITGMLGAWEAARTRSRLGRGLLLSSCVLCLPFWTTAPSGWWAAGPPPSATPKR
jgi:hypothetical protein